MAQNDYGVWQPLEPDGSGRHEHWSGADGSVGSDSGSPSKPTRSWSVSSLDHPLTYPTSCWWCEKPVFFHTNGFGDCVLFDRLGWPWAIHSCWAECAAAKRSSAVAEADVELEALGFDGRSYEPTQTTVARGRPGHSVTVFGFVADNDALYVQPRETRISTSRERSTAALTTVHVADSARQAFAFVTPLAAALRLDDYSMIRVSGTWCVHDGRSRLVATSFRTRSYAPLAGNRTDGWRLQHPVGVCYFCGRPLVHTKRWGFDPALHPECGRCSDARGSLGPREFLALCRRIVRNRS